LKLRQLLLALLFVCFGAVTVLADGVPDGSIKVGRGTDPSNKSDFCGLHFTFSLNGKGGGIENCLNTSGQDWIGLVISAVIPATDTVNCVSLIFTSCTFTESSPFGNGKVRVDIVLSGGAVITAGSKKDTVCSDLPAPQSCFFINLNDGATDSVDGSGGWFGFDTGSNGGNIKVDAITAPEPGTILLLAAGLGMLSLRRRVKSFR
jgi:hypothetical protein